MSHSKMRLVWATDVHLEFADEHERKRFAGKISDSKPDALILTGDIANGRKIEFYLKELQERIKVPLYFNLGNHDFYGSSIRKVRDWAAKISEPASPIQWIEQAGIVPLTKEHCLIGIDGWGDANLGDPNGSRVILNDWEYIEEFAAIGGIPNYGARCRLLRKLGKEAAEKLRPVLAEALEDFNHVLLMTHVPPWKEATWHEGKHSNDEWLPWFSCKAVGDVIIDEIKKHDHKQVTVFCGHTHGFGHSVINDQVDVYTGGAQYGHPEVQYTFEMEGETFTKLPANWYSIG